MSVTGLEFGTSAQDAIAKFTWEFGPPTDDAGVGAPCSEGEPLQHREVSWGGLSVLFNAEHDIHDINGTAVPKPGVTGLYSGVGG